ncbi:DNA repair protein RecO [Meridianimarinicoccus roseus]|uniref:DNA repair protein RecO n=1 Tax=Meridianimarinicoccus roseus TaxID=2072018 RepID=A0A2V2LSK8_9RHOB|nr:DNA repair protein RecO [Meridianimarinicoccus roseus]PWR04423.1 DNA repair protein RecO [Meridianimarinicoccus roseus]
MDWREEGVLLAVHRHGESAAIIETFTETRGRHAGVVRGGGGRRLGPVLQPGAQLDLAWRARLEDHLGAFTVEPVRSRMAGVAGDRLALSGLTAVCGLLSYALPERAAYPALYRRTVTLLDLMGITPAWPLAYLQWEVALLEELGFALDLTRCAVTGATDDLVFVSPRTGRAVSRAGAGEWADRLLPLPPCLRGQGAAPDAEIAEAMRTTGHFLLTHLEPRRAGQPFPPARQRLVDRLLSGR